MTRRSGPRLWRVRFTYARGGGGLYYRHTHEDALRFALDHGPVLGATRARIWKVAA